MKSKVMALVFMLVLAVALPATVFTSDSTSEDVSVSSECWVAIAINKGKRAIASDSSLSSAQLAAMKKAGMPGASIWSWKRGGCLALAVDQNSPGTTGMDGGITEEEAVEKATSYCIKMGGTKCQVVLKKCCQ